MYCKALWIKASAKCINVRNTTNGDRLDPEELCLETLREVSCKDKVLLKDLDTCVKMRMLSKIDFRYQLTSMNLIKSALCVSIVVFKAGFVLGALEQSFSGGFSKRLETQFFWIESVSVSSCHSRQTDEDQIRLKSHWVITING